jgi:hypothetical protein
MSNQGAKKPLSRGAITLWWGMLTLNFLQLNNSIWIFLLHLSKVSSRLGDWTYLLAGARLVNAFVFSWFLFTELLKPGFTSLSPPAEMLRRPESIVYVGWRFIFVSLFANTLVYTTQWVIPVLRPDRSPHVLVAMGSLTVVCGSWRLYRWLRQRSDSAGEDTGYPESEVRKAQSKAFGKLERLTTEEQAELSELLLRVNETPRVSLNSIVRVVLCSLVFSLLHELAEELLRRL